MGVEPRHLNLYSSEFISNRELLYQNQSNVITTTTGLNEGQMGSLRIPMLTTVVPVPDCVLPLQPKTSINTDSGLTYNVPTTRKRSRDCFDHNNLHKNNTFSQHPFGFDIVSQLQQNEIEIDGIISQYTKKMMIEIEDRQKQQARLTVQAIGEGLVKKMREKDERIQKMGKLNLMLQEKLKSLHMENQLWRDMAQTNEVTANTLRTNLEQVLAHVSEERFFTGGGVTGPVVEEEDVQSCCGSNISDNNIEDEEEVVGKRKLATSKAQVRMCRVCGERESFVLLLPCRHLCLCTYCGTSLVQTCPVCNSNTNATVHVNMSSS